MQDACCWGGEQKLTLFTDPGEKVLCGAKGNIVFKEKIHGFESWAHFLFCKGENVQLHFKVMDRGLILPSFEEIKHKSIRRCCLYVYDREPL